MDEPAFVQMNALLYLSIRNSKLKEILFRQLNFTTTLYMPEHEKYNIEVSFKSTATMQIVNLSRRQVKSCFSNRGQKMFSKKRRPQNVSNRAILTPLNEPDNVDQLASIRESNLATS